MPSNRTPRLAFACVLTIALPSGTWAQSGAEMQALQDNCKMDYLMFCAGLSPEGPEIRACFQRNRAKVSVGCASAIAAYEAGKARRQSSR